MAKGHENIKPPQKGERRNPKGRPKKLLSAINEQLLAEGYEKITPSQVSDGYSILLGLPEEQLKAIINDKDMPMLVRVMGKQIFNDKRSPEIIEMMLSRAHGKPMQPTKNENKDTVSIDVDFSRLTNEELDKYISIAKGGTRGGEGA